MKRIALTGDTHAKEGARWDDHCNVMTWMAKDFADRNVDLVAHAGDVFDAKSSSTERAFIADWTQTIARESPIVFVPGNHDDDADVVYLSRLRSRYPILASSTVALHDVAGIAVATLPWPKRPSYEGTPSLPERDQLFIDAIRDVCMGLAEELHARRGPKLLVGHVMVDGARTNHDQPLIGMPQSVSAEDLALSRADFIAIGHVHSENEWLVDGTPVVYTTAPRHTAFGPPGPVGYVLAEFHDDGGLIRWNRIATPARPMLLVGGGWQAESGFTLIDDPMDVRNAEIRFRYAVSNDQRDQARARARELRDTWLAAGAAQVKVEEEVEATTRARTPEIAAALTLPDQLRAMWNASGNPPSAERAERMLGSMLESLEREVA